MPLAENNRRSAGLRFDQLMALLRPLLRAPKWVALTGSSALGAKEFMSLLIPWLNAMMGGLPDLAERVNTGDCAPPHSVSGETQAAVRQAIRESFVAGFRLVAYLAAGLALMSALASWLLIAGRAQLR